MSEMDTYAFMQQNGRSFFDSDHRQVNESGEMVGVTVGIQISKAKLREIHQHCLERDVTIEDFLSDVIEGWLSDN